MEDSPADLRIIMESLNRLNETQRDNPIKMDVIMDGKEAYKHLCQLKEEEQIPGMILLNLNLPGMAGPKLLREIRSMPKFNRVPVVIHTCASSFHYADVFVKRANAFMQKPLDFDECIDAYIKTIDYWLNCHAIYY